MFRLFGCVQTRLISPLLDSGYSARNPRSLQPASRVGPNTLEYSNNAGEEKEDNDEGGRGGEGEWGREEEQQGGRGGGGDARLGMERERGR